MPKFRIGLTLSDLQPSYETMLINRPMTHSKMNTYKRYTNIWQYITRDMTCLKIFYSDETSIYITHDCSIPRPLQPRHSIEARCRNDVALISISIALDNCLSPNGCPAID